MNESTKTNLIATGLTGVLAAAVAAMVIPHASEALAGLAVVAGLLGIGTLELKRRAY